MVTASTNITTATFTRDNLYAVREALANRFRPLAQWFGSRTVYDEFLKLANTGAFIWLALPPGQISNTGYSLIGSPANEASGMTTAITTTNKVLVYGDPRYYLIVDRIGLDLEVTTSLYQQATMGSGFGLPNGSKGIYALWRNYADVVDVAAFRTYAIT